MPIYEYQCENCGHQMEKLQRMSDDPLKDCPQCNEPSLRKLVSAAAFKLKGTGWYETDFKDNNTKKPDVKSSQPAEKSDTATKTAPQKEAKPEKKPAASTPSSS